MNTRKWMAVTGIVTAMAAPAGVALACGRADMAAPMAMPMAAPTMIPMAVAALPQVGVALAVLPEGAVSIVVNGATFFRAGPTWYQPFQAPTGMMYRVVPAPHGM